MQNTVHAHLSFLILFKYELSVNATLHKLKQPKTHVIEGDPLGTQYTGVIFTFVFGKCSV